MGVTRDSFVFYRSFIEACKELDAEDFKAAITAMCDYALDGEETATTGVAKALFTMAKPVLDANTKRYENGCKGGRPKNQTETEQEPNENQTETNAEPYEDEDVDVNVDVDIKEKSVAKATPKEKTQKRFSPPTTEQVKEYCLERGNSIDPEAFVDFYSAKGWKVGSQSMKDWRAAVRTWEKRDKERARSGTSNKFNSFEQRQNDFDEIESRMFNKRFGT